MTDSSRGNSDHPIRPPGADRDVISAVKLSEALTAEIDAFAEAHDMNRSDAIRQLVQVGLNATSAVRHALSPPDPVDIESLAVSQIDRLLDPSLTTEERDRRIRRLTEGPPEFADARMDLAKRRE